MLYITPSINKPDTNHCFFVCLISQCVANQVRVDPYARESVKSISLIITKCTDFTYEAGHYSL